MQTLFVSTFIKLFFLLTPFFVVTMFLTLTKGMSKVEQRRIAMRVTLSVLVVSFIIYFFGDIIFDIFGLTVDAFRIGAGALLFLSAVSLVRGKESQASADNEGDISVVPLAVPITVGPATIGTLLVMGAGQYSAIERVTGCAALTSAVLCVGLMLYLAGALEKILGRNGLSMLQKLTGLILSALAAQIVFTGIKNFMS